MIVIIIILFVLFLVSIVSLLLLNGKSSIQSLKSDRKLIKTIIKYEWLYEKTVLKKYYDQLRNTIYLNELLDEVHLRRKAFIIMTKIILKVIIITLSYLLLARDVFVLMAIPISIIIFHASIVKYLRAHDLQMALRSGIELYKNKYLYFENCKIALEAVINEREGTIKRHFELLYFLIDAPSEIAKQRLDDYFLRMPSGHLQLIAMNNYIAYFEGDPKENDEFILVKNTQSVIKQMRNENTQREKFFREIKTDNMKMLSPIVLLPLIRTGVMNFSNRLPEAGNFISIFYNGVYGQVIVAFILLFMLFSYQVHSKFVGEKYLVHESSLKVKKALIPLIRLLASRRGSKKEKKLKEKLMHSGRIMSVDAFYQMKITTCVAVVLFSVFFIGLNHYLEENKILNNLLYSQKSEVYYKNLESVIENKTEEEKKEMIKEEKEIINKFKEKDLKGDALEASLKDVGLSSVEIDRVMNKIEVLRGISTQNYKLILIVFLIGLTAYNYPNFNLKLDAYINESAYVAEDISRLYSVAIVLSRNKDMTIREVLKWLEKFSVAFKPIFVEINENYHEKGIAVLERMYKEVPYEEMQLLLDNIKSGEELPLSKAFKGVEQTLASKLQDRAEEIEYGIDFQITLSESLAGLVQLATFSFYGALPLLIAMYKMLSSMFNKIEGL